MTLKERVREITDPARHPELLAGYDEKLEEAFRDANPESDDEESICPECGEPTEDGLCADCKLRAEQSASDMLLHRWNMEYAKNHGIAPETIPYHLLNHP